MLCIRSGASTGVHVYVQSSLTDSPHLTGSGAAESFFVASSGQATTLHTARVGVTVGAWIEINLARTDGRNFAQKLEAIMSCLMLPHTTVDATVST